MSGGGYNKGFGRTGRGDQAATRDRTAASAGGHDARASGQGSRDQRASVEHGGATGDGLSARKAAPRPWAEFAGRFGLGCAVVGGLWGLVSLVLTGNWAAAPVLAVLMGLGGAITFWLVATVLDGFRRVRWSSGRNPQPGPRSGR